MITIDQLLESVDLDFEPRFVTKDSEGVVCVWKNKPEAFDTYWSAPELKTTGVICYECLKLAEFEGKDWPECIYEVPRKVDYSKWIGKLCRFWDDGPTIKIGTHYGILTGFDDSDRPFERDNVDYWFKHCEPVRPDDDVIYKDAVNELKGAKNE